MPAILALLAYAAAGQPARRIAIDYPLDGSVFPPEITAPEFSWHDEAPGPWRIDIDASGVHAGSETGSWTPSPEQWDRIKHSSVDRFVTVSIGSATVRIATSRDPVGAPIFYRDVPLMPAEVEKGVIKPLAPAAIPLISWRLRDIAENRSKLVLSGLHSCTNCHSFSSDGKTLGMDLDGPENDKGTYAIVPVQPRMVIRDEDVVTWNDFRGKPPGSATIGFLSQISPNGRYAVTTLNEEVYVANFKDFRFLQVFYPTRGILAWYDRAARAISALPGADDPRYVHTDAVWTPDGESLIFARAAARDAYPPGRKLAGYAGDPNETPIQYDLYRIPFNGGRGGRSEPLRGASANGMSNSFPKVSPDGKWVVYVQSRNGQLMRPDGRLFIVPAAGGDPRLMRCNTPLMNSWHSWSPNGRWMVFASKWESPYTRMYLTHIDENGNDTPPIRIDRAAAPDRAVNLPEFVNIPPDGLQHIDVPAAEFYRLFDSALELQRQHRPEAAIAEWRRAIAIDPKHAKAHTNLGIALWGQGARTQAIAEFRKAVELKPNSAESHNNLAVALIETERFAEAAAHLNIVLQLNPDSAEAYNNLAAAYSAAGRTADAAAAARRGLAVAERQNQREIVQALRARLAACRY